MAQRVPFLVLLVCIVSLPAFASPTRNNDDSCDVAALPAATLLLPYFEVNLANRNGPTTLFTITNASPKEQIAHVTLWTDYAYPVLDFNVYLTGYDTQSINLYDIIARGIIAPQFGTGTNLSEVGQFSVGNDRLDLSACDSLPGRLPGIYLTRMRQAFTQGRVAAVGSQPACNTVGNTRTNAVGYATVDVVRSCTTRNPSVPGYLTEDILWDNVLLGDYQQVDATQDYAEGGPMVHIRAVSEGGTASERRNNPNAYEVTFHRTFYSRFLSGPDQTFDARQPLPALFAAHWINGTQAAFQTSVKIWREGRTSVNAPCSAYAQMDAGNSVVETILFDEEENPEGAAPSEVITPLTKLFGLPATSLVPLTDRTIFPRPTTGAVAGWMYINLDYSQSDNYASQGWVITSMRSQGKYSVDQDAFALGNGCTPPVGMTEVVTFNGGVLGPAANVNP